MNPNPPGRLDAITTRWSLIRQAHMVDRDAAEARKALVLRYAKAVRSYVGGMLRNREDADELAQDVVVRLLKGDFAGADPTRGRFRDLLKTAARNMVRNFWEKQSRRRPVDADRMRSDHLPPAQAASAAAILSSTSPARGRPVARKVRTGRATTA